jgi:ATP-dependent Clp protease ATP-binding subunit ClpX
VICPIHQLGQRELIRVLTEPRNAVVAQFQQLFQFDGIELVFAADALGSIAHKALLRAAGARGLRSIIEELLLDLQFELRSRSDVRRCVVTRQAVEQGRPPILEPTRSEQAAA